MKKFAVIVAGGSGSRMDSNVPKQFMLLNGRPVLWYSINAFLQAYADLQAIVVLPEAHAEAWLDIVQSTLDPERVHIIAGGPTRFHSVKHGLSLVDDDAIVFVHDAVRCLVTTELIVRCYEHALQHGNAIPAIHATDTIRIDNGQGASPVDRNKVYVIQTPQTFQSNILKAAFGQDYRESFTDEATVAEFAGHAIHIVQGERTNIKITWPVDLSIAEAILDKLND
ncbi:MAG TPA: 2-C-methyl-D-erythritol 4-phosphate cytidylyltransferase [Chitinophagaceae bacterium]|nr:2-C-methyl-D-erythritol 4-phosphate cytidylyltransferase [Chitinophagaceae bacterium]